MRKKTLPTLLKKREQLELEIAAFQVEEKRRNELLSMPEFVKILTLPNEILRQEFVRITTENAQPT